MLERTEIRFKRCWNERQFGSKGVGTNGNSVEGPNPRPKNVSHAERATHVPYVIVERLGVRLELQMERVGVASGEGCVMVGVRVGVAGREG